MAFWDSLTKGTSSDTGAIQGSNGDFTLTNPNGPRPVTNTNQLQNWNAAEMQANVSSRLQTSAQQNLAGSATKGDQGTNPYGVQRLPWIFATFDDLTNGGGDLSPNTNATGLPPNAIVWYANPKSVNWKISQRGTESKTKSGTTLHIWRDRLRKTDYDDPKITMTFQSGNIMPQFSNALDPKSLEGKPDRAVPPGLNDFYKFLQLVDASKIKSGQANLVHILYRSRIFPAMVISGFFDPQSVVSFDDSADNPFQVNSWTATFTIYKTVPAINKWQDLANAFQAEFGSDPLGRAIK